MLIDLRSDTVTQPSAAMREYMMQAKVGDDVFGEDPTVNELQDLCAKMFGKEAGLFFVSGTMANQAAIRVNTTPGGEVICHKEAHVYKYEGGGIAVHSHCSVKLIDGNRGRIKPHDVAQNINNPQDVHLPLTQLVCLEDTANRGGGAIYNIADIEKIAAICKNNNLSLHLDGARVFNALIETKADYIKYAANFDTLSICLSKGLGAPMGSVLIGSKEQIKKAHRIRKVLGGGTRQAGIIAAAGIFALKNNIDRLKTDHENAKLLAREIEQLTYVEEILPVETNIVVYRLNDKINQEEYLKHLKAKNVLAVAFGPQLIRLVTHLDFKTEQIEAVKIALKM
jgi:threonine aldolase